MYLSKLARNASRARSARQRFERIIETLDAICSGGVFLNEEHFDKAKVTIHRHLFEAERTLDQFISGEEDLTRLTNCSEAIERILCCPVFIAETIDGRTLKNKDTRDIIESMCNHIIENYRKSQTPEELVATVLNNFSKKKFYENLKLVAV